MTYFYSFSAPYFFILARYQRSFASVQNNLYSSYGILGHDVTPPVHPLKQVVPLL